ncbi:MAG TPA: glycerol-3-phosphate 1-O-acyltransferase PlsY [Terriglobales bacterium]|jgi:glycerol-3-phosphate acyltransferase PlsY|nr:glycerol-3-phosphate 1-O-acyltransferase PlsY [Terriglobales bacterium]
MVIGTIIFAYLLGSIPTGYVLGSFAGVDIRAVGSGNIGATNVARVVGKWSGIVTLIVDAAKGFIPVYAASLAGLSGSETALAGLAAVLGHLFPIFLKFKGGKGVATALGVLLAVAPLVTLILLVVFAAVMAATRIVSLSSITAALAAPVALWLLSYSFVEVVLGAALAVLIVARHYGNICRLLAGTEPRFGSP